MQVNYARLVRSAFLILPFLFLSQSHANPLRSQILTFEETTLPSWVEANSVELTSTRAILGDQSLLWRWNNGDTLDINHAFQRLTDREATDAYGRKATQALSFWIYNDTAIDAELTVRLSDSHQQPASMTEFPVQLNFTGWRAVGVSLNLDFTPEVTHNFAKIQLVAPSNLQGELYIDRVMVSVDDERYQWSDYQVQTRYDIPEIDFGLPANIPNASQAEIEDANRIKEALIEEIKGYSGNMEALESKFADFNVEMAPDGTMTGRHILTDKQQVIYQHNYLNPEDKALFDEYAILGDSDGDGNKIAGYAKLMLDIAAAYHEPSFAGNQARLEEMYVLLTRHLIDQGFAQGSSMVTTHHWGYSGRWWYSSAILMEDSLITANLLSPTYEALLWLSREFKESFDMDLDVDSSNLDYFNTLSIQHLALILLTPEDDERVALLKQFSHFFSGAVAQTPPGYHDGFRDDGTAWRHNGHYPGYAFAAFENAAIVMHLLSDTLYHVQDDALNKLKKVMVAGWRYSNPAVPIGISGRHPFTTLSSTRYAYGVERLAKTYSPLDTELAAIYLQISNQTAADSVGIFGQRIEPAAIPQGNWSYNGGAFMVHRSGDNLALVKGYNKDVWSAEIYTNDNRYGRYQSHGGVQVVPYGENADAGHVEAGWDWNRNPGTTTIHVDFDTLESPRTSTLMLRSDEGISGSTSLDEQYGVFAFKHKAPQHLANFEPSFVANKFVLSSQGNLYLTGDGISNQDGAHPTETTLFQVAYSDRSNGIWVNGMHENRSRFEYTLSSGDWIIDDNSVGYYLIDAPEVTVKRQSQSSRHNKTKQATSGEFTTAWINHGVAPDNASYQYVVVMNASPSAMTQLALQMQTAPIYEVVERTDSGQLMVSHSNDLYGYSNFTEGEFTQGPVRYISTAAQVLVKEQAKRLLVSISSSELAIQADDKPTPAVSIEVELAGHWRAEEGHNPALYIQGDNTIVQTSSQFGQATELTLCPVEGDCEDSDSGGGGTPPSESKGAGSVGLLSFSMLVLLLRRRFIGSTK
ncbi:chondroitinase family polysaccharide lyase [Vibrio nomapromontoriensis]|uniref:chondroitinase family polysaccharide lyase n=1 Tax=Vibrio nomapromontoriensis TaxID=2910246 RepID=UPI003D0FDF4C